MKIIISRIQFTLLILFSIFSTVDTLGQSGRKDFVFNWNISKDNMWIPIDTSLKRFNPTPAEVQLAKELSKKYLDSLQLITNNDPQVDTLGSASYNHENYTRQYLGYIDNNGNKIIFINACCSELAEGINLERHWLYSMEDNPCYFQVKVNLKAMTCFGLNGNKDE
ncbi:MAG TPA: hypothetical protein VIK89_14815 [Cytophagaceae bacterium]